MRDTHVDSAAIHASCVNVGPTAELAKLFFYHFGDCTIDELLHLREANREDDKVPEMHKKIDELGLTERTAGYLKDGNVVFLGDLVAKTVEEILELCRFSHKSLNEIEEVLAQLGLCLGLKDVDWASKLDPRFFKRVGELELSIRSANGLKNEEIIYVGDLVQKTKDELLRSPSFGRKSIGEIAEVLSQMGLSLGMTVRAWPAESECIEALARRFGER